MLLRLSYAKLSLSLILGIAGFLLAPVQLQADGCYICKPGSSANCKHYCKYRGDDDWENRKKCQKAGCDIGGTASCPTGANYQVCYVDLIPENPAEYLAFRFRFNLID